MKYITATELRTRSKELVNHLKRGGSTNLIHKSKIVGVVKPVSQKRVKPIDDEFIILIEELVKDTPKSHKEREDIYRKHLMDKYG